jgi:hypothetical protein
MAEKTDRLYLHLSGTCIPPPTLGGEVAYVQNVTDRESIFVDIVRLPKRCKESIEEYYRSTEEAVLNSLEAFALAGHDV